MKTVAHLIDDNSAVDNSLTNRISESPVYHLIAFVSGQGISTYGFGPNLLHILTRITSLFHYVRVSHASVTYHVSISYLTDFSMAYIVTTNTCIIPILNQIGQSRSPTFWINPNPETLKFLVTWSFVMRFLIMHDVDILFCSTSWPVGYIWWIEIGSSEHLQLLRRGDRAEHVWK